MREALIAALERLADGDKTAAEEIVNLFMPRVDDPRHRKEPEAPKE